MDLKAAAQRDEDSAKDSLAQLRAPGALGRWLTIGAAITTLTAFSSSKVSERSEANTLLAATNTSSLQFKLAGANLVGNPDPFLEIPGPASFLLEHTDAKFAAGRILSMSPADIPSFSSSLHGKAAARTSDGQIVFFSIDPRMQAIATDLLERHPSKSTAIVAMDSYTGEILAFAGQSQNGVDPRFEVFPTASIFKIVTAAAALESGLTPESQLLFRGSPHHKFSDYRRGHHVTTLAEALGKSNNPAIGGLAIRVLSPETLSIQAERFGFNTVIPFDTEVPLSVANIPTSKRAFAEAAAGISDVVASPIHIASILSGLANGGIMPRPYLVERVVDFSNNLVYSAARSALDSRPIAAPQVASSLLQMMARTTLDGTAKRDFEAYYQAGFPAVSGKTGTLYDKSQKALVRWFAGLADANTPDRHKVAVVVVSQNPGISPGKEAAEFLMRSFSQDSTSLGAF